MPAGRIVLSPSGLDYVSRQSCVRKAAPPGEDDQFQVEWELVGSKWQVA